MELIIIRQAHQKTLQRSGITNYTFRMNSKSQGIIVDCKNCKYISGNENSCFYVAVPIKDKETGITGSAELHCTISDDHHTIELKTWQDARHHSIQVSENLSNRLAARLSSFADQRICGNCNICPSEVIRIVEATKALFE